jgi:hypothetical protein
MGLVHGFARARERFLDFARNDKKVLNLKRFVPFWLSLFLGAASSIAFPTEEDVKALHQGMTPDEVVSRFGEPTNGRANPCIDCGFSYIPPAGSLNVEKEGYAGVRVEFALGKLRAWHIFRNNPSYDPDFNKMTAAFRWWLWIMGGMIVLGVISRLIIWLVPVAIAEYPTALEAFAARSIPSRQLPAEFRFITHETTLQEVIDRVGLYSRAAKLPVDPESGLGYAFASADSGASVILTFEYHLPYHAAIVIMPEYPFEPMSRIRAVFYRPLKQDLAEAAWN